MRHVCSRRIRDGCSCNCERRKRCCRRTPTPGVRTYSGAANNLAHPLWGRTGTSYRRVAPETPYVPGSRPSPREISTKVCRIAGVAEKSRAGLNNLFWILGQLFDHTVVLTPAGGQTQVFGPFTAEEDPQYVGYTTPFTPSLRNPDDGQPFNALSTYCDAACLYGANEERSLALRKLDGSGELKLDEHGLLPRNTAGFENANETHLPPGELFLAGDVRANEHVALTAMHTLWAWEHNHWCRRVRERCPRLRNQDELIFQMARRCVNAVLQSIVYDEFVPALLGPRALSRPRGYQREVDPTVANEFAACAFRIGHTMVPSTLRVGDVDRPLRELFFNPSALTTRKDVADNLLGASRQRMNEPKGQMTEELRSFLFRANDPETKMLLDLCFANIQRGRDHAIPDYNACRRSVGLPALARAVDISSDPDTRARLAAAYGGEDAPADVVDAWVGGVCEDHVPGALVGPLFHRILRDTFQRLRDGDRFWHTHDKHMPRDLRVAAAGTTLAAVFRRHFGPDCGVGSRALYVPR